MIAEKKCIDCLETKSLDEFYKRPGSPDGHRNNCKRCVRMYSTWKYRKQGSVKKSHYENYGLTLEQWLELREKKKHSPCEICGTETKLVVDHDHASGEFRGLLCHGCNTGLGFFFEDTARLEAAAEYIRNKSGKNKIR